MLSIYVSTIMPSHYHKSEQNFLGAIFDWVDQSGDRESCELCDVHLATEERERVSTSPLKAGKMTRKTT